MATTIDEVKNGGNGGNGGTIVNPANTNAGNDATTTIPTNVGGNVGDGGGSTSVSSNGGNANPDNGIVEFGNGGQSQQQHITTTDASDPTQAALRLVEQNRQRQLGQGADNHVNEFLNYQAEQSGLSQSAAYTPLPTKAPAPQTSTEAETDVTEPKKQMSYVEMYQALNPYEMPTKEEIEKQRKKEKRDRLFASIGDAVSALSNLYFTTQYAPNMYNPANSQYGVVDDRWTKLRKERDENRRRYVDGYLKAAQADDLQKIRQQNADTNADYKKAEAERKSAIAKAQNDALGARQRKDDAAADLAEKKLEYLIAGWPAKEAEQQAKIDLLHAREKQAKAAANNANASADEHNRRGTSSWVGSSSSSSKRGVGSSGGEYVAYDEDGNEHRFKQKGAAEQYAREHGTWQTDYATSTNNKYGIKSTTTSPHGGHSVNPKPKSKGSSGGGNRGGYSGGKGNGGGKKKTGVSWK